MLNKECCKKCHKNRLGEWDEIDDVDWRQGEIFCPDDNVELREVYGGKITEPPPDDCPFILEHILTKED